MFQEPVSDFQPEDNSFDHEQGPEVNPAHEAGKYLMADTTAVSPQEAQEALDLLVEAGFEPQKLADTFNIPLANVPDIVVKAAKVQGEDFVTTTEDTIREAALNGLDVFRDDLQTVLSGLGSDMHSLVLHEVQFTMMDLPGISHPATDEEIADAAQILQAKGVNLEKAGVVYGILPSRVAEYFARSMKGFAVFDSIEEKIENARENEHPIF